MENDLQTTLWFTGARAAQFASCLLIFGVCVFDRVVIDRRVSAETFRWWRKMSAWLIWPALVIAGLSGIVWFVLVAMAMSDSPLKEAMHLRILRLVLGHTQFGHVWRLRVFIWIAVVLVTAAIHYKSKFATRSPSIWLLTILGAALLGSLAWSGHGRDVNSPELHLMADVVHLTAAAAWPTGLLPFSLILFSLRKRADNDDFADLILITRRFSAMSLISVGLLAGTGIVNCCFLLGSVGNLISTSYGHVLCVKIAIFLAMVTLGAVNLLYLKPRLASGKSKIAGKLQMTVGAELIFAIGVVVVLSLLGTLPPG